VLVIDTPLPAAAAVAISRQAHCYLLLPEMCFRKVPPPTKFKKMPKTVFGF
jgi:hypothetical protein